METYSFSNSTAAIAINGVGIFPDAKARLNVQQCIDGTSYVTAHGYSDIDRTLQLDCKLNDSNGVILRAWLVNNELVYLATVEGFFSGYFSEVNNNRGIVKITFQISEKIIDASDIIYPRIIPEGSKIWVSYFNDEHWTPDALITWDGKWTVPTALNLENPEYGVLTPIGVWYLGLSVYNVRITFYCGYEVIPPPEGTPDAPLTLETTTLNPKCGNITGFTSGYEWNLLMNNTSDIAYFATAQRVLTANIWRAYSWSEDLQCYYDPEIGEICVDPQVEGIWEEHKFGYNIYITDIEFYVDEV